MGLGDLMLEFKEKKILNYKLQELNNNLENNYKDLAHTALKELEEVLEDMKNNGLSDRVYNKYRKIVDGYKINMKNYHH